MTGEGREVGIVKFYNPRKGYGFITRPDGTDVFFHLTHFRTPSTPSPGNVVRFALGHNREGLTAEDVVLVPGTEVERYGGTITELDDEGGVITTPDQFEIAFRRSDFIPHTRADSLRAGDEVEMNFLIEGEGGAWRAAVVRAPDFDPDAAAVRTERREVDDDEENRRLLGILYKTDLDEEAIHAARLLTERNMRATLSALVSRVFDRRLSLAVRRELVALVPEVYFDDECQDYLQAMAERLSRTVDEEHLEHSPGACTALELLLDDQAFPMRWSQYFLPFALTLLRNLSTIPSCHSTLERAESAEAAQRLIERVCRHVEQRRSGHGYVLTTALATADELWQRELLHEPIEHGLGRLLAAVDAEGLANQLHHLRDKISGPFLTVLLPVLAEHPGLAEALATPAQSEVLAQWIDVLLRDGDGELPTAALARLLPLVEELQAHAVDQEAAARLAARVTEHLTGEEVGRLLAEGTLPEATVWACLRHLDRANELGGLLADERGRALVTDWLQRSSASTRAALPREQEINTALRLIDSLRHNEDLRGELAGIGRSLFAGLHQRIEGADSRELVQLLERLELSEMPGLMAVLIRRLTDPRLEAVAQQRVLACFARIGPPISDLASAVAAWRRQADQPAALSTLISLVEEAGKHQDPEVASSADVLRAALHDEEIAWYDGYVTEVVDEPDGTLAARLEGFAILVPQRLFGDPADCAPNRYVRLLHRHGTALGVLRAAVPASTLVCGRLAGPLRVDRRNAMVGTLVDLAGETSWFEVANMRSGFDRPLQEGVLLRFVRMAAADGQACAWVAFNVEAAFSADDLPLLLDTYATAQDEAVAQSALQTALQVSSECSTPGIWRLHWEQTAADRRQATEAALDELARQRLKALVETA